MTSITTTMSTNEFWKKISYDPAAYFDEFSGNLVNDLLATDIDCTSSFSNIIKEENEEIASSPEADQHPIQASSTNSPPTESFPLDLQCGVCGAPAHGYNFDRITCESCKAFFRRNALRNTPYLKCRFSGSCVINIYTRRQCTYCRLKKCFDIKMRKDWIRTNEERELRRLKSLNKEQRKLSQLSSEQQSIINLPLVVRKKKRLVPSLTKPATQELVVQRIEPIYPISTFGIHRNLSFDDKILLNNIMNAYKFGASQADCSYISRYTSSSSLSQFMNDESIMYQSLIYFYKNIPEFKQFDLDDQILLIKCNMVDIIHLHHIIVQGFQEIPQIATHMSKWISQDFHQQMSRTRQKFDCFMKYPAVLQIALIVFMFSINLSSPRGGCSQNVDYKNRRNLYLSQNFYVALLWRYLNYLFDEKEAVRSMQVIVMQILRYQTLMDAMDKIIRRSGHQDIFNPLVQSVLGLT